MFMRSIASEQQNTPCVSSKSSRVLATFHGLFGSVLRDPVQLSAIALAEFSGGVALGPTHSWLLTGWSLDLGFEAGRSDGGLFPLVSNVQESAFVMCSWVSHSDNLGHLLVRIGFGALSALSMRGPARGGGQFARSAGVGRGRAPFSRSRPGSLRPGRPRRKASWPMRS